MMAEKIFRILSLSFLTVGFVVGVASADKDGDNDVLAGAQQLITNVGDVEEANAINNGTAASPFIIHNDEPKPVIAKAQGDYIPLPTKKDLSATKN